MSIHEQVCVKSVADVFSRALPHIHSTSSQQERQYSTCVAGLSHHSEIAKRLSPHERDPVVERPLPPCHRLAFRLSCITSRSVSRHAASCHASPVRNMACMQRTSHRATATKAIFRRRR